MAKIPKIMPYLYFTHIQVWYAILYAESTNIISTDKLNSVIHGA